MKKFLFFTLLLMGSSALFGQTINDTPTTTPDQERPAPRKGDRKEKDKAFFVQLEMDEQQVEDFRSIQEKYRQERRNLMQGKGGDREAMRSQMQAIDQQLDQEIKGILSPSQFELYAQMIEEKRAHRKQQRHRH